MADFFFYVCLWTLALYGLIEIIISIYYRFSRGKIDTDGVKIIISVKNQEQQIEGICRTILYRHLSQRKEVIDKITVVDLNSSDNTKKIIEKLEKDYGCIKLKKWEQCKKELDYIFDK